MKNSESLKKSRDFQVVYKQGTSIANKYLVMYVKENCLGKNRIGISEQEGGKQRGETSTNQVSQRSLPSARRHVLYGNGYCGCLKGQCKGLRL